MAADKRTRRARPTPDDANVLRRALHALGDYGHVSVRAVRGHLTVCVDDGAPVARATPLGAGQFGLSFHTHSGRWEPMPVVADLTQLAHDLVGVFGPYLQRPRPFSPCLLPVGIRCLQPEREPVTDLDQGRHGT